LPLREVLSLGPAWVNVSAKREGPKDNNP